jgi:hypothetical protein
MSNSRRGLGINDVFEVLGLLDDKLEKIEKRYVFLMIVLIREAAAGAPALADHRMH